MIAEMTADPRGDVTRSISGWEIFSSVKQGMMLLKVHKNENFFGSDFEFSTIFIVSSAKILRFGMNTKGPSSVLNFGLISQKGPDKKKWAAEKNLRKRRRKNGG